MKKQMVITLAAVAGATAALAQGTYDPGNENAGVASTATQPSTEPANNSSSGSSGTVATNGFGRQHYVIRNNADTNQADEFNSTSNTTYSATSTASNSTKTNERHHWWQFWK